MVSQYYGGMNVWVWYPDLVEDEPAERGWYPAEVTSVDESKGFLRLAFGAGELTGHSMISLESARFKIYPHPEPPPYGYEADLLLQLETEFGNPRSASELEEQRNDDRSRATLPYSWPDTASMVARVEAQAEADAAAGRPPDGDKAIRQAVQIVAGNVVPLERTYAEAHAIHAGEFQGQPGCEAKQLMAERYGLFYGAKRTVPHESADVVVWRWREVQDIEEPPIYSLMREDEQRNGISIRTRATRLEYAVAAVLNEYPQALTLAALESRFSVEALSEQYPEVREHYCGEDREDVREYAAAELREVLAG